MTIATDTDFRALALELLDYATRGAEGRSEVDPIYTEVTETRDQGKAYSSCGDLAHWMLYRLGVRGDFINRKEHKGWKVGVNVARLAWRCHEARPPKDNERFAPGDILIVWSNANGSDAHVLVVREHTGTEVHSADYGQPGGARKLRRLFEDPRGRLILDGRQVQRVLPLADVLAGAKRRGELAPVELPIDLETGNESPEAGVA